MPEVRFIQYLLPHGQQLPVLINRPHDVYHKAEAIIAAGYTLCAEMLRTGEISFTITDDEADHAIRVCKNGPEVLATVDRLINDFKIPEEKQK